MKEAISKIEKSDQKLTYEVYCQMSSEEKAEAVGFVRMRSFDTVKSIVEILFYDMEHNADVNEIMDETKVLYERMGKYVIKLRVDEILEGIEKIGYPYQCLTNKEKTELFNFQLDDNGYNLKLYFAVLKVAGVHYSMDESYEDYQRVYDKTVDMQMEKKLKREMIAGVGYGSDYFLLKKKICQFGLGTLFLKR